MDYTSVSTAFPSIDISSMDSTAMPGQEIRSSDSAAILGQGIAINDTEASPKARLKDAELHESSDDDSSDDCIDPPRPKRARAGATLSSGEVF